MLKFKALRGDRDDALNRAKSAPPAKPFPVDSLSAEPLAAETPAETGAAAAAAASPVEPVTPPAVTAAESGASAPLPFVAASLNDNFELCQTEGMWLSF